MYCVFYTLQIWNFNKLSLDFEERCPLHNASFFLFTNFGRDEVSFGTIVQNFVWLHLFFYFFFFFLVKINKIHLAFQNKEYCKNYIILRKKGFPLHIDSCIDDETLLWNHQEFKLLASITLWKLFSNLNSNNLANIEIFKHCYSKII